MPGLADILAEKGAADGSADPGDGGDSGSMGAASMKAMWEACKKGDFDTAFSCFSDAMQHSGDYGGGESPEMMGGDGGSKPKGVVIAIGHPKG